MGGLLGKKVSRAVKACESELLSGPSYQEPWRVPEGHSRYMHTVQTQACTPVVTSMHAYPHTGTQTHAYKPTQCTYMHMHQCTHAYCQQCTHAHTSAHMYTREHKYMHTYQHSTHIQCTQANSAQTCMHTTVQTLHICTPQYTHMQTPTLYTYMHTKCTLHTNMHTPIPSTSTRAHTPMQFAQCKHMHTNTWEQKHAHSNTAHKHARMATVQTWTHTNTWDTHRCTATHGRTNTRVLARSCAYPQTHVCTHMHTR